MRRRFTTSALLALGASLVMAAPASAAHCGDRLQLNMAFKSMKPLWSKAAYQLWATNGRERTSSDKFNIAKGRPVTLRGRAISHFCLDIPWMLTPTSRSSFFVTIEPRPDKKAGPSPIKVLKGVLNNETDAVVLNFPAELDNVSGSAILTTPTDTDTTNETAGYWFMKPGSTASLRLPTLPAGWAWESWVRTQGKGLSGGKFKSTRGADRHDAYSGPLDGPAFPGEDLVSNLPTAITPPVNLATGSSKLFVSIEPDVNNSDVTGQGMFGIVPLSRRIPEDQAPMTSFALTRSLGSVPRAQGELLHDDN